MKFRKKPIVIEAVQYKGLSNYPEICEFMEQLPTPYETGEIAIETLEGRIFASAGDWIIRGISGEFYPCKPDIFEQTYEPVEEER